MDALHSEKHGGIPWMAILDADGTTLVTSDGPNGNIGYPSDQQGIDHFIEMLESTAQRLTPDELVTLRQALQTE
ncbi:hypothetical protein [Aeoliella mucimassa]|nr:hypothetical protein [Aeoliella mucimassa]